MFQCSVLAGGWRSIQPDMSIERLKLFLSLRYTFLPLVPEMCLKAFVVIEVLVTDLIHCINKIHIQFRYAFV